MRAAQSTAMNRLIKASSKVEVDPEAMEKLMVERGDFLHALENDIKPVCLWSVYLFFAMKLLVEKRYLDLNLKKLDIYIYTTLNWIGFEKGLSEKKRLDRVSLVRIFF